MDIKILRKGQKMDNKEELNKQVIILSLMLLFVIIIAIFLNTRNFKNNNSNINVQNNITSTTNSINQDNLTQEDKIKANLKGLLEESDKNDDLQEEMKDKNETVVTTKNGETIIIKD